MAAIVSRADCPSSERVALDVLVEGADVRGLAEADVRRLFPGTTLTVGRLNRLRHWPRLVVRVDDMPAGVATYTQTPFEMQIPDFSVHVPANGDAERSALRHRVLNELLDAIELASMAGGCRRIVVIPSRVDAGHLERRGYVGVNEGCAGAWMEKALP